MLREHLKKIDLNMPRSIILPVYQADFDARPNDGSVGRGPKDRYAAKKAMEIFEKFSSPWIVRSLTPDGMGVHLAKTYPELISAIEDGINNKQSVLVGEFITGKAGTVHSVGGFRGEDVYTFPPSNDSNLLPEEKNKIISLVKSLHQHLGAENYLKSDFVLTPRDKMYITGISFSPDLRDDSHFCNSCELVGAQAHHVIEHILESVLN